MKKLIFIIAVLACPVLADQCQITSPLPVPITISGCTYSGNLPSGSTSYIQNTSTLQSGSTAYPSFVYVGSSETVFGPFGANTLSLNGTSPAITINGSGAPPDSQALCLLTGQLGHCTTVVGSSGGCTCSVP